MKYPFSKFLFFLSIFYLCFGCARRGSPTGGAIDTIPPVLIKALPEVETINFTEKKIKIYFDEYIKLKDVKQNLVISPPQKNDPVITPLGTASKLITIKILDTLDDNTTFSFNFGNSIVDNNEENKLGNFKYVFSTGSFIDSLKLKGKVLDPKIKDVTKDIDVMLYEYNESFTDSIIYKEKPRYIANTLDSSLYDLTNLRAGKYLLIALKDVNNNKMYDPLSEKIGFIGDTVTIPKDTVLNLTIFKEIPLLKVIKPKEVMKGRLIFGYQGNAEDLIIELLTEKPDGFKSKSIFEKKMDTISYWYTPFENDSLNFIVSKGEYSENFTVKTRKNDIDSLKIDYYSAGFLDLIDTFSIATNTPITNFDKSLIKLTNIIDSVNVDFNAILSKSNTKVYIDFEKKYDSEYSLEFLPKTITDIFGISNDTLAIKFKTKSPEDYGIIKVKLTSSKETSFIVELLDEKGYPVRIAKSEKPETINFELLNPGNYLVRITLDENNNGIWDTGSFLEKRQPETIVFFNERIIELRANWDPLEEFNLDEF